MNNEGLPITTEWEDGYDAGMEDAANGVPNFRPYRNPYNDWKRGYNDAFNAYVKA